MSAMRIAGRRPEIVTLTAGETVWWCRSGQSGNHPWCDGQHATLPRDPASDQA